MNENEGLNNENALSENTVPPRETEENAQIRRDCPPEGGVCPPEGGACRPEGGYPPEGGAYRPEGGAYRPEGGGYPPEGGAYRPEGGAYRPEGGGCRPEGGYPPEGGAYRPEGGACRPEGGGYPPEGGAYRPEGGQYGGYPPYNTGGAPRFASGGAPEKPKKKKRKGLITAALVIGLAAVFVLGGFAVPKIQSMLKDSLDYHVLSPPVSSSADDSSEEETSVPEIVGITPLPEGGYESLAELYKKCSKSCVTIICDVHYNEGFFSRDGVVLGSGFVVEGVKKGEKRSYIVTNHHVIDNAKTIKAKYSDGEVFEAKLVGSDELSDIAVLTTERKDVTPIEMGDSSRLQVGQWVVAIGTPSDEKLQNTMSYGIVSGLNRELPITNESGMVIKTMKVIQTTATLNPGNSGGPLINMAGQVVGINAMKLMQEYEGIGFALPSTEAGHIINSLIEYGTVKDPSSGFASGAAQLGITGTTVTDETRQAYELGDDCPDGVLVVNVNRGTAVYKSGLSIYDIITEFDGKKIKTIEELKELISKSHAGDKVTLTYYRIGRAGEKSEYKTIKFKLDNAK